jgi:hypothetical protein
VTTTADVLSQARNDYLLTGNTERLNRIDTPLDASTETFSLERELKNLKEGNKLSCELEDMYVLDVNEGSKTVTVIRGYYGTTAAAHPVNAVLTTNSRFTDAQILRTVNAELASLSSPAVGLFRMSHVDVTYNDAVMGYDMTGTSGITVQSIWQVRYKNTGPEKDWPVLDNWALQTQSDTTQFASGNAFFLRDSGYAGNPVRIWYKTTFAPLATLTDNVLTVSGLHLEAHDILPLGAAVRLTVGREIKRNFDESQGDTRRAGEVPPGANVGAFRVNLAWRAQRIKEEAQRLQTLDPMRLRSA